MDEMFFLRMMGFGSGVDLAAVFAFVAFAIVSLVAPVIGYRPERSPGVSLSLFLLIGYVGVSLSQLSVQWVQLLDGTFGGNFGPGFGGNMGRNGFGIHILFAFALLKLMFFLAAMLSFAIGLRTYRLRGPAVQDPMRPPEVYH